MFNPTPADYSSIFIGSGCEADATNVLERPLECGAALSGE